MIAWEKISSDEGFKTTKDMFEKMYGLPPNGKGLSIQKMAERFGCSVHAIREALLKNGLQIRGRGGAPSSEQPLKDISLADFEKNGARHYATLFQLDVTTVYKHFKRRQAEAATSAGPAKSETEQQP